MSTIKSIFAHPLCYPELHAYGELRYLTLMWVETKDGTVDWGEAISQFSESCLATKILIERGFAPLLVDQSAIEVEAQRQQIVDRAWWFRPQGIAAFAISAIDMALWDAKGGLLGLPLCNPIGGKLSEQVVAMTSVHLDMDDLDLTVAKFGGFRDGGSEIVKGGCNRRPEAISSSNEGRDLELARWIRETISPAIDRVRRLEKFRLLWIEGPLPPQDYEAYAFLISPRRARLRRMQRSMNSHSHDRRGPLKIKGIEAILFARKLRDEFKDATVDIASRKKTRPS